MDRKINSFALAIMFLTMYPYNVLGYLSSSMKEPYLSDAFLRDIVDRMGKDLVDAADAYIDPLPSINEIPSHLSLMARASKDLEAEQMDYDSLLEGNPSPSLRDQEYMQHSSLWGHHYIAGGGSQSGLRQLAQIKTDATLPAYCNPPNPCPVGFTQDQGCEMNFENSAAFSRDYQASQECMCDAEHMFNCPGQDQNDSGRPINSELESYLSRQFPSNEHKNLVAKKFHPNKAMMNPYLEGEKLPVAAKKGNHAY